MTNLTASMDWKRFFQVLSVITLSCVLMTALMDDADAKRRKKRAQAYSPPYSEIVVDINSGKVLRAVNPDAPRFPASITKVMTLYMLFEQLERGKMTLSTPLEVSAFAASQAPSKLGLRPGSTIAVEDAIFALVTKSANDVAVTVAENIAGDQDSFARMMTRKARQLGMSRSTFRNASGLPNKEQVTTARDLVRLGVAMKRDFPQYAEYFKTRAFAYQGRIYPNHNRLLGRVEGVDGMKTGYTRASGFNLLTSAKSGNRQIMTVVLGGRSGRARDARVASLVNGYLGRAVNQSNLARIKREEPETDIQLASASEDDAEQASSTRINAKAKRNTEAPAPRKARPAVIAAEASTPAETTLAFAETKPQLVGPAVLRPSKDKRRIAAGKPKTAAMIGEPAVIEAPKPEQPDMRWVESQDEAKPVKGKKAKLKVAAAELDDVAVTNSTTPAEETKPGKPASGWVIQLAAAENEAKALKILDKAKAKQARLLSGAVAFTEQVQKGESTLWRARFGGFDGADAQAACSALKKSGFNCLAQRV
jgi:D-alanyl-D-alanine carboxypeptidase